MPTPLQETQAGIRHPWALSVTEATALQRELAARVRVEPLSSWPETVAGADISFDKYSPTLFAAVVVLDIRRKRVIDVGHAKAEVSFPYVPGYLSFREIPAVLQAYEKLSVEPDLIMCDGQGYAHPRRLGLACHLGLWLNKPTIGCAKSLLCGEHKAPGRRKGCHRQLIHRSEVVGEAVRTRDGTRPVYVSIGHRITLPEARRIVLRMARYRIPEPTRRADMEVNALRRGEIVVSP